MPAPGRRVAAHTTWTLFPAPRTRARRTATPTRPSCIGVTLSCLQANAGGGGAFMELQFHLPGEAPFADGISCDHAHWCAALTIDSLECTLNFATCNPYRIEPVNFGFIQTNGVPTGPPGPRLSDLARFTPNASTLLMNPGDKITVHMFDATLSGGGHALEAVIRDATTRKTGFMQAPATNGFMNTSVNDSNRARPAGRGGAVAPSSATVSA